MSEISAWLNWWFPDENLKWVALVAFISVIWSLHRISKQIEHLTARVHSLKAAIRGEEYDD